MDKKANILFAGAPRKNRLPALRTRHQNWFKNRRGTSGG